MKKYISLLLATAATIACTKVALEDNSPIESLPQEGNTENVQGEPSGEKIIISLAETKVSLDKYGDYQFDGDEVIYVQASSTKAVAKLQNSAAKPTTFTGEFNGLLGETSETFDFYYNCTDENANVVTDENGNVVVVKVQNGQPWLAAIGVKGDRDRSTASEYSYKISNIMLKQLDGYVCLALNSYYECTVDFHTLSTELPKTTITGIQLGSGSKKPYFVNIKSGMTGGFYLTVTYEGQKMYTSYGTNAKISSNQIIMTKKFEAFSITGQLVDDTKTTFKSTYDVYQNSGAGEANKIDSDIISSGEATFTMTGISKTIRNLVSLKNITVTFSDKVSASVSVEAPTPAWTETKSCTITIPETKGHNKWGPITVENAVAVFSTPDGNDYQVSFANPSMTRHITGLPYRVNPPSNSGTNKWTAKNSNLVSTVNWKTTYVHMEGISAPPEIVSPSFHIPENLPFSASFDILIHSRKPTFSWGSWMYPTFTAATNVGTILTQKPKAETEDCTYTGITGNATFTTSANTISLKSSQATTSPYIRVSRVDVIYRDE